jgi:tRNA pseudouridine55 synthase
MSKDRHQTDSTTTDGLLVVHKPRGIASTRLLYQIRKLTGVRKSGHAGTLDPLAEGVLILCLGRGTKLVESIMHLAKVYSAVVRLDVTNPAHDLELPLEEVNIAGPPELDAVRQAARGLEGHIMQAPPVWSAAKIGGRPAYKLALKGKTEPPPPRPVTVYWIHVQRYAWPELEFEVACARGTYIRALIRDWGRALGAGGVLTFLQRTAVGPFDLAAASTPEEIARRPLGELLVPLDRAKELIQRHHATVPPRPLDRADT